MGNHSQKWNLVVGARPNFMKIAPLVSAIREYNRSLADDTPEISFLLVHTGQHYDINMSDVLFDDLKLPKPDIHLEVGPGTHGEQTGKVLIEFEKVLFKTKPDIVIVVGDVNSTLACSLAAAKLHIPIAHVEAGLRSFDRTMPEEINRIVTDSLCDYLFTPSQDADENLIKEGIPPERIFPVGNIMVDSLLSNLEKAKKRDVLERLGLRSHYAVKSGSHFGHPITGSAAPYVLLTLHRPANVDEKDSLNQIVQGLLEISSTLPVIFPGHPRTRKRINEFGMKPHFEFHDSLDLTSDAYYQNGKMKTKIHCFEPLGYLDFLSLTIHSAVVLTDSGGIQEETTVLNIPCVTLRDTTERPITLTQGTNVLVGNNPQKMVQQVKRILKRGTRQGKRPVMWDGHTAERIVKILAEREATKFLQ